MSAALWSLWWVWIAAALVLAIVEVMLPGFLFLGFAIGAALVGLLLAVTGGGWGLPLLLVIFAALSLIAWAALRRTFRLREGQVRYFEDDVNK
ncbi:hypothetical protein G5B38_02675 [Pseudohalocynthiibacter aestuariivivens]|uniref:NfeD-like C-terminal, partner-binding n=1 Tax=Roseovarius pelagicus TaxID=2980108 RepID=A0ABY6DFX8_9RHOB|nr:MULTISPECIES: hypothetical protein [Rhodobacterales]QIE47401.1 hypothetical protein G5B38_02675 [Pseudohalocynthiibacter aestuariivivens]UXX85076.1 hypothetical protein N7U68_02540 [Roseovarius pelagicus]